MKLGIFANKEFISTFNKLIDIELPSKVSYKISLIHRELSVKNEEFEEQKKKIFIEYARKDENGELEVDENGNIKVDNENLELLNTDLNKLSMTDFTVGRIYVEELGDISLPPKLFSLLSEIIIL